MVVLRVTRADSMPSRVTLGVDFAQSLIAHVGIDSRGIKPAVAKQLLNHPQVSTVVEHVSSARVPKQVASTVARHSDGIKITADHVPHRPQTATLDIYS